MNIGVFQPGNQPQQPQYSPTNLIISVDQNIGKGPLKKAIEEYKAEILYDYNIICSMAIKIPPGKNIDEAIEFFKNVPGVIAIERDGVAHTC